MSPALQSLRFIRALSCLVISVLGLHFQQWAGTPLYFVNKTWYYTWQAMIKAHAVAIILTLNHNLSPTTVVYSGDSSVSDQIEVDKKGRIRLKFAERMILMSNHHIYIDSLVLWWAAYSTHRLHGRVYFVMKESLRKIPIFGTGMKFFSWVFLSRNWKTDAGPMKHAIDQIDQADPQCPSPMWLIIYPEGTNLSKQTRAVSQRWADRNELSTFKHLLLPRSRGLQLCVERLSATVEWLYDATVAYDGIPTHVEGEEFYSLKQLWLEGRKIPAIHVHWRRFAMKDIPWRDDERFHAWLLARWAEKEQLLQHHLENGAFPVYDAEPVASTMSLTGSGEICSAELQFICTIGVVIATSIALANHAFVRAFGAV